MKKLERFPGEPLQGRHLTRLPGGRKREPNDRNKWDEYRKALAVKVRDKYDCPLTDVQIDGIFRYARKKGTNGWKVIHERFPLKEVVIVEPIQHDYADGVRAYEHTLDYVGQDTWTRHGLG